MKKSKLLLISKNYYNKKFILIGWIICGALFWGPQATEAKIYIDINAPSATRIKIAIPYLKNFSSKGERPELAKAMAEVLGNDLDLTGYFEPMDPAAFLEEENNGLTVENIRFENWSAIKAELLVKAGYTCVGQNLELEFRLYDVSQARQVVAKRFFGRVDEYRTLMHRAGNEIVLEITGFESIFLTKLAFVDNSTGNKEINVSDFDGYNVRQITFDKSIALFPKWSPQGDKLAYNSFKNGQLQLFIKDMLTGTVAKTSGQAGINLGGRWTPDGRNLALTLTYEGDADIYLIDLEGRINKRLTNRDGIDVSPTFSPDGTKMAFCSDRSGSPQIYVKDLIDGTERRITYFPEGEGSYNSSPHWSVRNQIIFSSLYGGHHEIFITDPRGESLQRLTGLNENQGNNEEPCWSPDGRYIIFSSNREGPYHLYMMNVNGHSQRKITNLRGSQTSPSWGP
jgi:TolB protein